MNKNHALCATPEWAQLMESEVLEPVTSGLDLGIEMLELGPGPGAATRWLRHGVKRLVALELDPGAAARLAEELADTNVTVQVGDSTQVPFPDESFDSVGGFTMLHHLPTAPARLPAGGRLRPCHGLGRQGTPPHRSEIARGKELRMSSMSLPYNWTLHPPAGESLPGAVWLASRLHVDSFSDLPERLQADFGRVAARVERAILALGEIARVHLYRWGGGALFHVWFLPRPLGMVEASGMMLPLWEDTLANVADEELAAAAERVAALM